MKKSEGYSVEQLERLYSLLSQCIYQHRREYEKTQLLEVRDVHCGRAFLRVFNFFSVAGRWVTGVLLKRIKYHNIA